MIVRQHSEPFNPNPAGSEQAIPSGRWPLRLPPDYVHVDDLDGYFDEATLKRWRRDAYHTSLDGRPLIEGRHLREGCLVATKTPNGAMRDARSAARFYLDKRLAPIPLPWRSKGPVIPGWQVLHAFAEDLDRPFPAGQQLNIGVLNGAPSGNTLDVDLDCPEALLAAPRLLAARGWIFGRKSAPRSHWIYRCDRALDAAQEKYTDLDGTVLVGLRGTGGLTVFPPSTHKDTGEVIAWERCTEPGAVTLAEL